jgi:hypothetical protein
METANDDFIALANRLKAQGMSPEEYTKQLTFEAISGNVRSLYSSMDVALVNLISHV